MKRKYVKHVDRDILKFQQTKKRLIPKKKFAKCAKSILKTVLASVSKTQKQQLLKLKLRPDAISALQVAGEARMCINSLRLQSVLTKRRRHVFSTIDGVNSGQAVATEFLSGVAASARAAGRQMPVEDDVRGVGMWADRVSPHTLSIIQDLWNKRREAAESRCGSQK